ncbi:citrate transporter [Ignatzschineria indica]|uniref:Citrate transporter n=2 Tax=Ignatzschineria TaxID=112008 RepID=A0A2U2AR34_9GAMM|nr:MULTISPECIES: citrate:proton symporter [Ignatzschineria]PWD82510.1 citrate transporter [Ignatzschineria indica]PWD86346.1 citrate transporter [Ignatzschineria cameli]PWD89816.1 citrate transporter [Ignatzschineria cameli]PWD91466.1 citrate transporter [Ignatzschineria cameli]PWD92504.1 citrate transporter [Ignatzschineria cameli]
MLSLIGFATILTIVTLLIRGKVIPIVALTLIPIIGALVAGFGMEEIGGFFKSGLGSVMNVVVMFIFAIIFFGILQDAGLFDPLINKMIQLTRGNIITICIGSVIIAAIAQLDGSGASTFLITIPALLPLYKRMRISPYLLVLLIGGSASIMNMIPWGGPLGRTASVIDMDVTELWRPLIPVQVVGMILMVGLATVLGMREKRRIAALPASSEVEGSDEDLAPMTSDLKPGLYLFNLLLTIGIIAILVTGIIPAGFAFMIGVAIALPVNFRTIQLQNECIKRHAPNALSMASIILAAGVFLGVLNGTGMLTSIAQDLINIMPEFMGRYIHLIIGFLGLPFDLLLSTDAYYFALLPVVDQIATTYGIASTSTAYAMIVGNIVGTFVSPFSPALWLALGLANIEMGRYIRYSFFWMWAIGILLLIAAIIMGVIAV